MQEQVAKMTAVHVEEMASLKRMHEAAAMTLVEQFTNDKQGFARVRGKTQLGPPLFADEDVRDFRNCLHWAFVRCRSRGMRMQKHPFARVLQVDRHPSCSGLVHTLGVSVVARHTLIPFMRFWIQTREERQKLSRYTEKRYGCTSCLLPVSII